MYYSTVFVGMDVHEATFTCCCYTNEREQAEYVQTIDASCKSVLNYVEAMRRHYGDHAKFICGYEAGCIGFKLYRDLTDSGLECVILAPTTMAKSASEKVKKNDKRDSRGIARCLAHHDYSPVNIPTEKDEQIAAYIRMRDDHKLALKKIKQQILAFCLRNGYKFTGTKNRWTQAHVKWLRTVEMTPINREILNEYLITYDQLTEKIERMDKRIEEFSRDDDYQDSVKKLECFIGIKVETALSLIVETGDFRRFSSASKYASYLGLAPGEDSSGPRQNNLSITKAGNTHLRRLLIESAQSYARGRIGNKSRELKARQSGNSPQIIAYADKANERLRRRYYKLVIGNNKKSNVAKTAVARELACFIWGMMTGNIA